MKWLTYLCGGLLLLLSYTIQAQATLAGTYSMEIPGEYGMLKIKLNINDGGTFTVDFGDDDSVEVNGNYEVNGNQITIWETSNTEDTACVNAKGVYTFTVDAQALNMDRISDPCTGRGGPEGKMSFKRL